VIQRRLIVVLLFGGSEVRRTEKLSNEGDIGRVVGSESRSVAQAANPRREGVASDHRFWPAGLYWFFELRDLWQWLF
jgi:hypothetical protein